MEKAVPSDAFCVSAITLCDLYPRDEWNFVFGLASHVKQVGVYSLARYSPGFYSAGGQTGGIQSLNKYVHTFQAFCGQTKNINFLFGLDKRGWMEMNDSSEDIIHPTKDEWKKVPRIRGLYFHLSKVEFIWTPMVPDQVQKMSFSLLLFCWA